MFESKYSKVLTGILIVVIIAIVGLLGFLGFDYFQQYFTTQETSDFVDNFQKEIGETQEEEIKEEESTGNLADLVDENTAPNTNTTNTGNKTPTYKGFDVAGTMEIPKINFKYPVLKKVTKKSIETAVAILYPNGGETLNKPVNTVIVGHNYRNGLFFSNLKKVAINDKIYVTDNAGNKITYTIYNKFETSMSDISFYERDTGGKAELTLSTCTDASNDMRLIILAKQS